MLTGVFGHPSTLLIGQYSKEFSDLLLPLFLLIPELWQCFYNIEFYEGLPLKKIQINSVLPAEHSLCPALLGALCPTEGLWSPLTTRDEEANSSIVLFSLFKSIGPKALSTCAWPSIWRAGMRLSLKGGKAEEKGELKMHWNLFEKQLKGRESSQAGGVFFTLCSLIFFTLHTCNPY